jgi:hypothetical protein
MKSLFLFVVLLFLHLLTCTYIIWASSSPNPYPPPPHPASGQNLLHSLIILWFYWRENVRDNKKDIAFCWFEIKIAIQRDSYHCLHVQVYYNLHLFISTRALHTSRSPFHSGLCQFKITIFTPLQRAHIQVSCFIPFLYFPHAWSPLSV